MEEEEDLWPQKLQKSEILSSEILSCKWPLVTVEEEKWTDGGGGGGGGGRAVEDLFGTFLRDGDMRWLMMTFI